MGDTHHVFINGCDCSALVVELDGGLRMQLLEATWDQVCTWRGDFVTVEGPTQAETWMRVVSVTRLPPVVWVVVTNTGGKSA